MHTILGIYLEKHRHGKPRRRWEDNIKVNVGFDVLTAVFMKSSIFWNIIPCSTLKINQHFGGKIRLYLQYRIIN
jgi:hypothetical protein